MVPTPTEAVELIANDKYAGQRRAGELAALLEPWLKDSSGWERFAYEGWPSYRKLSAAYYLLRAAERLNEPDSESSQLLIALGRQLCAEVRDGWRLPHLQFDSGHLPA